MAGGAHPKYDFPREELLPFVPPRARAVLDIGCGSGAFGRTLRRERSDLLLWGVEMDPLGAAHAEKTYDTVVRGEFPSVAPRLPRSFFQVVFLNDVVEHMADPANALEEVKPLLGRDGLVVASIPNVRYLGVLKPLVLSGEWEYEDYGVLDSSHLRFFTRKSMLRLFANHGFDVQRITGINRRQSWKIHLADKFLGGRLDDFLFQQYVIEARLP